MEPTFTLAKTNNIDTLVELMQEFYAYDHLEFNESAARSALQMVLNDPSLGSVWLIELAGETIGYVVLALGFSLEYRGRDAFIDELYIRASHRGQGIGKQALQLIEATCRSLGVQALHLEVERVNSNAQAVYRKAGFVDHDRLLMTKWISS
jgi:GNAT superfamily N-acetyltransferase